MSLQTTDPDVGALNKGPAFEEWGAKLVFLVQDVSIDYLRSNTDASGLHPVDEKQYEWERAEELSASFDAIADMMGSSDFPDRDTFEDELADRFD